MTKIALDYKAIPNTGIAKCTEALASHLPKLIPGLEIIKVTDFMGQRRPGEGRLWRGVKRIWHELFIMDRELRRAGVDFYHCTKNYSVPIMGRLPVVTTIHDIIPLAMRKDYSEDRLQHAYVRWNFWNALRVSRAIITDSDFSRDEILRFAPSVKDKISVVLQGCDQDYGKDITNEQAREIMAAQGVTPPYILTMGGAEPRKNVGMLLKLHESNPEALPHDLVIIGGDWRSRSLPRSARQEQIHILEGVSSDTVKAAYKAAEVFVYPSLYEGFGLPVLESMACSTTVLAHSGTSIPQVAGDAALLADMASPGECLAALRKLLSEPSLRDELIEKGLQQIKRFSWEKTAQETVEVYRFASLI